MWAPIVPFFAVIGGNHFAFDNIFKAVEVPAMKTWIKKWKKKKKARLEGKENKISARKILEDSKTIDLIAGK